MGALHRGHAALLDRARKLAGPNGTVVASYDKALLIAGEKLKSTDGTYGLRFAHNTDVMVTGLTMTKN